MIRTTLRAEIAGVLYEYVVELPGTAAWADTPEETAVGLLHQSMDQLTRALGNAPAPAPEPGPRPDLSMDQYGNRVCYLCGFYHDEPGACADPSTPLTNLNPGPPDPPEYDGPTMPDDIRYPEWEGPAYDDFVSPDTDHEDTHTRSIACRAGHHRSCDARNGCVCDCHDGPCRKCSMSIGHALGCPES